MAVEGSYRIAVDVGGTFTDLVAVVPGGPQPIQAKTLTTPDDPADGVLAVLDDAAGALGTHRSRLLSQCDFFAVGSTIATNTMLELNGAKVGLLCTDGFRDDLAIRRGLISRSRNFRAPGPRELVPRYLRIGLRERIDKSGNVLTPLEEADVVATADLFRREGVDAVAVCLFNSFLNPVHEERVEKILERELPGGHVSLSSRVLPILGEYPRVSSTVVDAYVAPRTIHWLISLEDRLRSAGLGGQLFVMQNNGGLIDAVPAHRRPVLLVLSGPAAGAAGVRQLMDQKADENFVLFDMGGTSTDITVIRKGLPLVADELNINGHEVMTPAVDVHSVAAGGGAIAHVDQGGLLRVGPRSAGARPGPVALGRSGTEPTVTDANVVLGRLDPEGYAGGRIPVYPQLARETLTRLGEQLETTAEGAALGVVQVAEETMARAIGSFSLRKGVDVRRFVLIAAGGAGGLHAAAVARRLGIKRVLIPRVAPVCCAMGMLNAHLRRDFVRSSLQNLDSATAEGLSSELESLRRMADEEAASYGPWPTTRVRYEYAFAMQYRHQIFQIDVPAPPTLTPDGLLHLREDFHRLHEERHGHRNDRGVVQVVRAHLTVLGELPLVPVASIEASSRPVQPRKRRQVVLDTGDVSPVPAFQEADLQAGDELSGPAVVDGTSTTILIPPGVRAVFDATGTVVMDVE